MLGPVFFALGAAAIVLGVWALTRRRGAAVLCALWLGYAGYEFLMYRRVLCSGECNIRVDLLLLYPLLFGLTLWLFGSVAWRALRARHRGKAR
jgi:hypothetical protein